MEHRALLGRFRLRRLPIKALPSVDRATVNALAGFRQGDLISEMKSVAVTSPTGSAVAIETPDGVVLVSQTCDVVQADRLTVQVARFTRLIDPTATEARDGRRPRYAHLPELGADAFADLEVIATVAKGLLREHSRVAGVLDDNDIRRFGQAVGRRFSRFAFPNAVQPWLQPLEDVARSKSHSPASPEGKAFAKVTQLRVECENGWGSPPYDLVLAIIVEPGTLPMFPDDTLPEMPDALGRSLYDPKSGVLKQTSGEIAVLLQRAKEPEERYFLWMALGAAWAAKCKPKHSTETVTDAVSTIRGEVIEAGEFSLTRVMRSEVLDLDHLSPPWPV